MSRPDPVSKAPYWRVPYEDRTPAARLRSMVAIYEGDAPKATVDAWKAGAEAIDHVAELEAAEKELRGRLRHAEPDAYIHDLAASRAREEKLRDALRKAEAGLVNCVPTGRESVDGLAAVRAALAESEGE